MSNLSLFVVGTLVTLLVAASMALLVWGAVLDGRDQRAFEESQRAAAREREESQLHVVDAA
jgi:hypothetical protein